MTIKTKSGFACEISEKKIGSWNMVDLYTKITKATKGNDLIEIMELTKELYVFTLGEDGYNALVEHLKDEDGVVSAEDLAKEFNAIMEIANAKKSKPSQR